MNTITRTDVAINSYSSTKKIPLIYMFDCRDYHDHDGLLKIGKTEIEVDANRNIDTLTQFEIENAAHRRIRAEVNTAGFTYSLDFVDVASFSNGEFFTDKDFHSFLEHKMGVLKHSFDNSTANEWYKITAEDAKVYFENFCHMNGMFNDYQNDDVDIVLRGSQSDAVEKMSSTYKTRNVTNVNSFLLNAKPRFGKCITLYDFIKKCNIKKVLVYTTMPAIGDSWAEDFKRYFHNTKEYKFVSSRKKLNRNKEYPFVISSEDYYKHYNGDNFIRFEGLDDIKGSVHGGGKFNKHDDVFHEKFDLVIVDESHSGNDTERTKEMVENFQSGFFRVHLSGTAFKDAAKEEFQKGNSYSWTYADEQYAKHHWDCSNGDNPYKYMPQVSLYTYMLSSSMRNRIEKKNISDGYMSAFDLSTLFSTDSKDRFVYDNEVDNFIDGLCYNDGYPYSNDDWAKSLKHTVWFIGGNKPSKSIFAIKDKLEKHSFFSSYKIVAVTGNDEKDPLGAVRKAIKENDKTITLTCGKLRQGVTVPEWTAVFMMANCESPETYIQLSFRCQNPHKRKDGTYKENCYIFDFDPTRTLSMYDEIARGCYRNSGNVESKEIPLKTCINFLPVIFNEKGEFAQLSEEEIFSIPLKNKINEAFQSKGMHSAMFVVDVRFLRSGRLTQEQKEIISRMTVVDGPQNKVADAPDSSTDKEIREIVIGRHKDILGSKRYKEIKNYIDAISEVDDIDVREILQKINKILNEKHYKTFDADDMSNYEGRLEAKIVSLKGRGITDISSYTEEIGKFTEEVIRERMNAHTNIEENKKTREEAKAINEVLKNSARTFSMLLHTIPSDVIPTIENFDSFIDDEDFFDYTNITKGEFAKIKPLLNKPVVDGVFKRMMNEEIIPCRRGGWLTGKKWSFDYVPKQKTNMVFTPSDVATYVINEASAGVGRHNVIANDVAFMDDEIEFIDIKMI